LDWAECRQILPIDRVANLPALRRIAWVGINL
jgi:hypothetical protein